MSGTASKPNAIGAQMATARRGGIDMCDVWRAKEKIGPRATPSMIARFLGCCVEDEQRLMTPPEKDPAPKAPAAAPCVLDGVPMVTNRSNTEFIRLWNADVTVERIARAFNISTAAVWRRRNKLGLPERKSGMRGPWTPENTLAALACNDIAAMRALAKEIGCSTEAVRQLRRRHFEVLSRDAA